MIRFGGNQAGEPVVVSSFREKIMDLWRVVARVGAPASLPLSRSTTGMIRRPSRLSGPARRQPRRAGPLFEESDGYHVRFQYSHVLNVVSRRDSAVSELDIHFIGQICNFGTSLGLELLHDVAHMHFDGALAHAEFISDDLVGLTQSQ